MSAECLCSWVDEPEVGCSWLAAENPDCPEHGPTIGATERGVTGIITKGQQTMSIDEVIAGIARWKATGFGIDPNQLALRHYEDEDIQCHCYLCADTPIVTT